MAVLKRLLCSALVLVGSCDFLREPLRTDFSTALPTVSAMLRAGSDTVQVLLQRPVNRAGRTEFDPISGSEVFIDGPDGRIVLREAAEGFPVCFVPHEGGASPGAPPAEEDGLGCYSAVLGEPIRQGALYTLHAQTPDGAIIHGVTLVSAVPLVTQPGVGDHFTIERVPTRLDPVELEVSVQLGRGAAGVEVRLRPLEAYSGDAALPDVQCGIDQFSAVQKRESSPMRARVWIAEPIECVDMSSVVPGRVAVDSLRTEILVTSFDSAYIAYLDLLLNDAVHAERASVGVEGAYGFFGSTANNTSELMLLPLAGG